uniref:transmembrane protein 181 isoform X2 n=1 Tax=Myxine glutinosa TaxID=7769 RepID=UPI00358F2B98
MEPSVHMRLYTLSKRHFVIVFLTFFLCFGVTVLIGIVGPQVIVSYTEKGSTIVKPPGDLQTGIFELTTRPLTMFSQRLWLTCRIVLHNPSDDVFTRPFNILVKLSGRKKDSSLAPLGTFNHSRHLHCERICDEIMILHLGFLYYSQYVTMVSFENLNEPISDVEFTFTTYNAAFTQLEIWFRFVFLVLTFMVTCIMAHSLRRFSMRDWSVEQRWLALLLPLLLLYDDPLFPLSFLVNSWIPGLLDDLFQATFLSALLLFWLCTYHAMRLQSQGRFVTFYLPKLLIVGTLWLAAIMLGAWQTKNQLHDPTFHYPMDSGSFRGMKIFFLIVGSLYVLYLVFLILRACTELRNTPYFDLRLKFLTGLTFVIFCFSLAILILRFGSRVLDENFIPELSTRYRSAAEFLSFYGLLNFYLYTLAFVCSPSKNAVFESQLKDNPAFSMLNDSDDDIIYGNSSETEGQLLQNGRAGQAPYMDESDSD